MAEQLSDEAEEVADEEEFCCRRRQLKEDVEVDLLGLAAEVMLEVTSKVGEEVANLLLLLFLALTRLWTTPPDGESSTR